MRVRELTALTMCLFGACSPNPEAPEASDLGVQPGACIHGIQDEACASELRALLQPLALPEARGNEVAEMETAAILGFHVFFDIRFSRDRKVRCEGCHTVEYYFADNAQVPLAGVGTAVRNSPTILNAARHSVFMWDGRAETLWSQPLLALEDPNEMGFTRLEAAHTLGSFYGAEYARAFGPLPDLSDAARFPAAGKPGDAAFDAMADDDKLVVNGVIANLGKALEAYMRKLATGPSRVDRYFAHALDADPGYPPPKNDAAPDTLLTPEEARGAEVFVDAGCTACHSGAQLSDDLFHSLGVPVQPGEALDAGRSQAVFDDLVASPFNAAGPFFDGTSSAPSRPAPLLGGFRTPSLRNLTRSQPYGHNGVFANLEAVVDFHLAGGGADSGGFVGSVDPKLRKVELSPADRAALIAFLKALDGSYPALPWGQWPSGNG